MLKTPMLHPPCICPGHASHSQSYLQHFRGQMPSTVLQPAKHWQQTRHATHSMLRRGPPADKATHLALANHLGVAHTPDAQRDRNKYGQPSAPDP